MKDILHSMGRRRGVTFSWHVDAASTNDMAHDALYGHGDVVVAESQSAGRGQQGNSWHSEPGKNLTFSIVLSPDFLPASEQFSLLQAVSLAVADTLEQVGLEAKIKWPNDIYIGDRKVAGLLIEHDISGMNIARTVAGIGLNVNQKKFPAELPNPTSMSLSLGGKEFDRACILGCLYDNLMSRYRILEEGDASVLERDYHDKLYRLGSPHLYTTPGGGLFTGIIRSVASTGELAVEHLPGHEVRHYLFKEIELVL